MQGAHLGGCDGHGERSAEATAAVATPMVTMAVAMQEEVTPTISRRSSVRSARSQIILHSSAIFASTSPSLSVRRSGHPCLLCTSPAATTVAALATDLVGPPCSGYDRGRRCQTTAPARASPINRAPVAPLHPNRQTGPTAQNEKNNN